MPQIAAWAATAVSAAAPAAATAATAAAPSLASVAMKVALNVAISAAMSALQPQVGSAGKTFEWTLDPNAPIPFAAGRVGVAGSVIHLDTFGPDKMYYGFVSVLSGAGPIKDVVAFKGDDEDVTFNADGKAVTSQWEGEMWMRWRAGSQPEAAAIPSPPGLKSGAVMPDWTAAHRMSGKAGYMLVLGENSKRTAYPTGEVKPLVTIDGLFGWDPRQDSTYPGGVGPCRLADPATWVWIDNPILWALKWSLGLWEGPVGKGAPGVDYQVGGIGAKPSGIDIPAFVAAANVAEANGWKVAAYPTTDDDKSQVLDAFLQAGGAIYAQYAGKISCIQRAAPVASTVTITARDTAGPLEIDTAASRIDRINTIRPRFWSAAHRWQMHPADEVTSEEWRTQDGGTRPRGIDFPYVPEATQAVQLAALQIAHTREGIAGVIPLKPHMQRVNRGTRFTISEPGFLLDGVKCLCLNAEYDAATSIHSVTFVSETDAKYPYALGLTSDVPAPPVIGAGGGGVTPPAEGEWTLTAETFTDNGASIPALVLTGEVDNAMAQSVVFEFRPVGAAAWAGAGSDDPTIERKEINGLTPGTSYEAAVSYRIGARISERLVLGPVTAGALIPSGGEGARTPVGRSVAYPLSAPDANTIEIAAFDAFMGDGTTFSLPAGEIVGLTEDTIYGVFWREGDGYEVETQPASLHMTTGRWLFLGWQATPDALGDFTLPPPPPGGWGGSGETPTYYAEP
jgi:hypothetical protein